MIQFEPHPLLKNGHLQTVAGTFIRRKFPLNAGRERLFRVDDESQLKSVCHWQEGQPRDVPVIVIVHGLEGSSDSGYLIGIADKALARGYHAIRVNQRNCGGTERLTPTLYNSGMSSDYRAILLELIADGFQHIFFAGYSMGGNLVTKMAGEWASNAPKELRGVAAVCPALDLSACADALEAPQNFFYQRHFVKGLLERYRRKVEMFPDRYSRNGFGPIRTVREFDDAITGPQFGYKDAEGYYQAAGAKRVIAQVKIPLFLMAAKDDPFVPFESFLRAKVTANPAVQFVAPDYGGHCGFISKWQGNERHWAEARVVEFMSDVMTEAACGHYTAGSFGRESSNIQ
jgi:predicted alpha/beta-fold hydrolase